MKQEKLRPKIEFINLFLLISFIILGTALTYCGIYSAPENEAHRQHLAFYTGLLVQASIIAQLVITYRSPFNLLHNKIKAFFAKGSLMLGGALMFGAYWVYHFKGISPTTHAISSLTFDIATFLYASGIILLLNEAFYTIKFLIKILELKGQWKP